MYTAAEIAAMTAAEQTIAREMNAAEEAGRDVLMDDEPHVDAAGAEIQPLDSKIAATAPPPPPAAPEPAAAPPAAEGAPAPEPSAAPPAVESDSKVEPPAPPAPVGLHAAVTADFDTKLAALDTKTAEIETKWAAGELSDDERNEQLRDVRKEERTLIREQTRAETIKDINQQNIAAANQAVIEDLRKKGNAAGLDYGKDTEHSIEFDAQLRALAASATWKAKPFSEAAAEAHRRVMAIHGKAPAAAAPPPAAPAAAPGAPAPAPTAEKAPPPIPATLRDLPNAARANAGDDLEAQWSAASGAKAEALWQKLTPAQQKRLLGDE